MLEQLRRRRPLVRLELPGLAGSKDSDESVPVLGLEVGCSVDDDELGWTGGLSGAGTCARAGVRGVAVQTEWSLELHEVGVGGAGECWVVRGYEDSFFEEGFHVRHADEG